jgi:hypothetical protein
VRNNSDRLYRPSGSRRCAESRLREPFLLLGEIENHTRGILVPLSKAELAAASDPGDGEREIEDVADLTGVTGRCLPGATVC